MGSHARLLTALTLGGLLLDLGCSERSPTATRQDPVPLTVTVLTVGTPVSTLVVTVTAADLPSSLLFNLTVVNGVASGTIKIPPGPARTIAVTAYDDAGNITHDGQATVDVHPGQNPPVNIKLTPRAGHVPIVVTFGSFAVVVSPAQATIDVTVSTQLQLSVAVTGADGQPIANPDVGWATGQPATAIVSPAGLVTGLANGVVTIAATYGGVAGFSTITVTGVGTASVCAPWTWTPSNVDRCAVQPTVPNAALSLDQGSYVFNTDDGSLVGPNGPLQAPASVLVQQAGAGYMRVVVVPSFTLGGAVSLRVTGSYSLVLLVDGNATVSGSIDVSAIGSLAGPGANDPGACPAAAAGTEASLAFLTTPSDGAGGGGGGGFGTPGGRGGTGTANLLGGAGQGPSGTADLTPLRGGCAGGTGGGLQQLQAPYLSPGGSAGGGGGALQISVRDVLTVFGLVRSAGGGGGVGDDFRKGGGGGGSGGAILLESNVIQVQSTARIVANGGSGAEGRDASSPSAGPGKDGTFDATAATTPNFLPNGGDGGAGGSALSAAQDGGSGPAQTVGTGAGGGGGGGVGRVRVRGVTTRTIDAAAVISPTPAP